MQQVSFDFNRADQLGLLRDVDLGPRSAYVKATLKAIDDFARQDGECFAAEATLARIIGCSQRTVERAIARLKEMSLITCELKGNRFGRTTNHYRIVWTELESRVQRSRNIPTDRTRVPTDSQSVPPTGPSVPTASRERSDTQTDKSTTNREEPPPIAKHWEEVVVEMKTFGIGRARDAALSAERMLQRCPDDVRSLLEYAGKTGLGPGLVYLILQGRVEWPAIPSPQKDPEPKRTRSRNPLSDEEAFRCQIRHRLMADGMRGEALIAEVETRVARWLASRTVAVHEVQS